MGTLKVDNLQKRDGTALITDGVLQTTTLSESVLRNANVGIIKLKTTDITTNTSTLVFDNTLITDNYDKYIVEYTGLKPSSDTVYARWRFSSDNGSSFLTGTFNYGYRYTKLGAASHSGSGTTKSNYAESSFGNGTDANYPDHGQYTFSAFRDSNSFKIITRTHTMRDASNNLYYNDEGWGYYDTTVINYMEFSYTSGNIADGTFTLYGVTK